jgi:GNAT superfamily N-acetyltransferase
LTHRDIGHYPTSAKNRFLHSGVWGPPIEPKDQAEVRQAHPDDWPAIAEFIDHCYGPEAPFKNGPRWRWQFLDTPYSDDPADVPVWIAVADGVVVGQIALQPARMFLEGEAYPAGWIVDVMIRPEHRGSGLGHRIHDEMVNSGRTLVTLTMAPATRRIADRAGAATLAPVLQMVRPRRLSGATISTVLWRSLEHRTGLLRAAGDAFLASRIGPAMLGAGISAGAAVMRVGASRARSADLSVRTVDAPDLTAAGAVFERCRAQCAALFDHGPEFIRWRMLQAPDLSYRWLEARRGGELSGLAATRLPNPVELPVGTLAELLSPPDDPVAIDALVGAAVDSMAEETEAIIAGASHPTDVGTLKRHGFHVVRRHRPTVVTNDEVLRARIARLPGNWRMSKIDHDWDQIHPAAH